MRLVTDSRFVRMAVFAGLCGVGALGCSKAPAPAPGTTAPAAPAATTAPVATTAPATSATAAPATTAPAAADAGGSAPAPDGEAAKPACEAPEVAAALKQLKPDYAKLGEGGLEVCGAVGEDKRGCITIDLATNKRTFAALPADDSDHIPPWPEHFDDGFMRDDKRPVIKFCASATAGCKDLFVGAVTAAHLSADKGHAVLTTVGGDPAKSAHVFDTKTFEPAAVIPLPGSELVDCTFASLVGITPSVVVSVGPCTGGEPKAWLAKADSGDKIADVPVALREGQWVALPEVGPNIVAFRAAGGDKIVLQDVITGEVKATIAMPTESAREAGAPAWLFATKTGFVVAESQPLPTTFDIVDLSGLSTPGGTPKVEEHAPVICP